ncbi:ATP-dependent DNA ligase [Streptomyces sp. NPDC003027]
MGRGDESFEALQRRAVSGGRTATRLAAEAPAHFIAFVVLQIDGQELLHVPYGERRARLERPFADHGLSAPWTLCPETTDVATAQEWLTSWTQVPGVEGLVIRGSGQRYLPGARALYKVRRRDTTEAVVGAITGTVRRPQTLVPTPLDVVLVEPVLVAEITVDTALERGAWRHPVRFARLRLDVAVADVPPFGAGAEPASG